MIYFDNSATTLIKPPEVAESVAKLIELDEPLNVAFTSSSTESLNLVISGLIKQQDSFRRRDFPPLWVVSAQVKKLHVFKVRISGTVILTLTNNLSLAYGWENQLYNGQ